MEIVQTLAQVVGVVVAAALAFAAVYAAWSALHSKARFEAMDISVNMMTKINTELRSDNAELRGENAMIRSEMADERRLCDVQIAELRGEVKTLQSETVRELVQSIGLELRGAVTEMRSGVEDAMHKVANQPDRRSGDPNEQ